MQAPYKLCMARSGMLFAQNAAGSIFYQVNTGGGTACVGNGAPYILVMQVRGAIIGAGQQRQAETPRAASVCLGFLGPSLA